MASHKYSYLNKICNIWHDSTSWICEYIESTINLLAFKLSSFRLMREMKQDNVCSFIGAFVEQHRLQHTEQSKVTLVTEYCTRGSLLDILGMDDIKLDHLFISSLVHDLLRVRTWVLVVGFVKRCIMKLTHWQNDCNLWLPCRQI